MYNSISNHPSFINYYQPIPYFQNPLMHTNRQYPYQFMQRNNRTHPQQWNPYLHPYTTPFHSMQASQSNFIPPIQGYNQHPTYNPSFEHNSTPSYSQIVFQNPLFEQDDVQNQSMNSQANYNPYLHAYPKASFLAKQPSGVQNVLNSFKSQDGTLDINKMVDTAGQMLNAVNQVSTVVKGIGGIFKA